MVDSENISGPPPKFSEPPLTLNLAEGTRITQVVLVNRVVGDSRFLSFCVSGPFEPYHISPSP